MEVPERITCVDCGGVCHRISFLPPDEVVEPTTVVAYRCADCADRWDIVVGEADDEGDGWEGRII